MGRIFLISWFACACARVSAHKLSSDISDTYFQVLIRADRDVYFSPDISDRFSELLYRHLFAILSLRTFRTYIYLRVWKKVYIGQWQGTYVFFFVPDKEFEKSVRFVHESPISPFLFLIRSLKKVSVLSVNLLSYTTVSTHCMVKKRRREGLYSFDLRNALDILMAHHFMGRVFRTGGHNRRPPTGISSRREESAGPYDCFANDISSRAPVGCRPNRSSGSERRRRRPPVAGCIS